MATVLALLMIVLNCGESEPEGDGEGISFYELRDSHGNMIAINPDDLVTFIERKRTERLHSSLSSISASEPTRHAHSSTSSVVQRSHELNEGTLVPKNHKPKYRGNPYQAYKPARKNQRRDGLSRKKKAKAKRKKPHHVVQQHESV